MKIIGKHICTILLTLVLIFTFAPWTGAMNEAYAATETIQSVNINCDIQAIGLKELRTESQVLTEINNKNAKCTTPGVVVRSSYDLVYWDKDGNRFLSITGRNEYVDPAVQYYLNQSLFLESGYDWPSNVKQATKWTKASSLAGFKVNLNNVNIGDAVICYVEKGGLDVNIPIGNDISKSTVQVYPFEADYTGSPLEPAWFRVKLPDGKELDEARYTMTYIDASGKKADKLIAPGTYKLKIVANGIYCGTAWGAYTIKPMDICDGGTAKLTKTEYTYDGKPKTPGAVVIRDGKTLKAGTDYTVSYKNNKNAGTATAFITGTGLYGEGWEFNFVIKKANNPLSMAGKTATVKWDKLKKKAQTLKVSKVIKFKKKGQGEMRYKLTSAKKGKKSFKKYFKVAAKNGKVTVKKGLEKGTFKVKVKVKAGGTANYKASKWKSVTFKVKVR